MSDRDITPFGCPIGAVARSVHTGQPPGPTPGCRSSGLRAWAYGEEVRELNRPSLALFRLLRRFAVDDPDSLPLLALICAFCRDAQLQASFPLIESLKPGEVLPRASMEAHLEAAFPERYSKAMNASLARHLNTSWTAAGHLTGRVVKKRTLPQPRVVASTYAMLAGYLLGLRGEMLTTSVFARLVGADPSVIVAHLSTAARNGWLRFRHAGGVMEIDFSGLLRPEEEALLHVAH